MLKVVIHLLDQNGILIIKDGLKLSQEMLTPIYIFDSLIKKVKSLMHKKKAAQGRFFFVLNCTIFRKNEESRSNC